jgi:molybdopterin synthase sulfur carrier subunit
MINILLFAGLAQQAGVQKVQLEITGPATIEQIKTQLQEKTGQLNGIDECMAAINEEYAEKEDKVQAGDTIAFIPPVSGG